MIDVVPILKIVIGEQPAIPELPPKDAQRRFQLVFRRFIDVFASPEHPLALCLDDLQWLDAADARPARRSVDAPGRESSDLDRRVS